MIPRLTLTGIAVRYRDRTAVHGLSATFGPGVTTLVGPNGAGKSSLLRVVAGVQRPSEGVIDLGGITPADGRGWHAHVGYLPQDPEFAGGVTVADTVALAGWLKGLARSGLGAAVTAALEETGLADRRTDRVRSLSGGMRRRLGFATAVVHRPALVVLDEPTAGLDPEQRAALGAVVAALATDRVLLVSTHVLDDLRRYGGAVAVMSDGRIAHHGPVAGMVAAAAASLGEPLDPARGEDLERAYLAIQARAAACSG